MKPLILRFVVACVAIAQGGGVVAQQQATARQYAIASGHPAATEIGLAVLERGGNVMDAAVAASLALGVAEPYGSGLGGKLILLYREASTGMVHSIVALCTSPAALDDLQFIQLPSSQRKYGYHAAGVPALVAGLDEAHRQWGSKPWQELVSPAAELADNGVEIDAVMRSMFAPKVKVLRADEEAAALYLVDGEAPPVGARMRNADLAESLRKIAAGGADAFYRGAIAERIVAAAKSQDAPLSLSDFRNYRPEVGRSLAIDYRGYRIHSCPPPLTGGVTVLSALKCLEQMPGESHDETQLADRMCRSLQCLYPRIRDEIADVPSVQAAANALLSTQLTKELGQTAGRLDPQRPYDEPARQRSQEAEADALPSASTSHLVVVDAAGNMVSLTQSLSLHFGAAVVPPGTGILLNDSMSNFSTQNRAAVNHVAPGKRARSTIAPIIVTKRDKPWLALGIPGGQRIPTTTIQLLWRLIDRGEPLGKALAASRLHLRRPLQDDDPANVIDYEDDMPQEQVAAMTERGWTMKRRRRNGHYFGGGNAAQYQGDGSIVAVADPRRTNFAAGK